jgi:hypothetical protein
MTWSLEGRKRRERSEMKWEREAESDEAEEFNA